MIWEALHNFFLRFWSIEILVDLLVPIALICWRLPHRKHVALRSLLVVAALFAFAIVPLATGLVTGLDADQAFIVFSALLAIFVVAIMAVCEVNVWTALFCATAGYTLQNLSSGLTLLVQMLLTHRASTTLEEPFATLLSLGVSAAVYIVGYLVFIRRVSNDGLLNVVNKGMLLMFAAVVVLIIGLDLVIKSLGIAGAPFRLLVLLRFIHPLVCVFVLFVEYEILLAQHMSDVRAETERLLAERERQYRLSRENIEAINIKCHDIRHQIRHLAERGGVVADPEALADIAREVNVYDSVVETGNEALDTILTEKSLACSGEGIVLSVIADGTALDFMTPADIYSLFGNALDNAIEATRQVTDPEHRTISLTVRRQQRMVAVSLENYYVRPPRFKDGMPQTTKKDRDNHGFGVRSMRATVERYGGSLHAGAENGVFYLNLLLTVPDLALDVQ